MALAYNLRKIPGKSSKINYSNTKKTFYKTRTTRVPSVAKQRISIAEGSMRMQMKSDILKEKSESERNEIWYIIAYRYILSFHTLVLPAHNHTVFCLWRTVNTASINEC
jgi:hypothetical protein